jgi:hypothetical protein
MAHRYQLGAQVGFSPDLAHRDAAEGPYEVVRQLPSASDGVAPVLHQERTRAIMSVAKESDLERT